MKLMDLDGSLLGSNNSKNSNPKASNSSNIRDDKKGNLAVHSSPNRDVKSILEKLLNTTITSDEFKELSDKCGNIVYTINPNTAGHTLNVLTDVLNNYRKRK